MPCGRRPKWRSNSRQPISICARRALSLTTISGMKPCVAAQVISSSLPASKKRLKPVSRLLLILVDEHLAAAGESAMVHLRQDVKLRLPAGSLQFLADQREQIVEVAHVAVLQQRIGEHRRQRRRDRHGHSPIDAVALQALEDVQQRNVRLGDGLVQPVLFEEVLVLGMAHKRQVCVQDETEVTEHVRLSPMLPCRDRNAWRRRPQGPPRSAGSSPSPPRTEMRYPPARGFQGSCRRGRFSSRSSGSPASHRPR